MLHMGLLQDHTSNLVVRRGLHLRPSHPSHLVVRRGRRHRSLHPVVLALLGDHRHPSQLAVLEALGRLLQQRGDHQVGHGVDQGPHPQLLQKAPVERLRTHRRRGPFSKANVMAAPLQKISAAQSRAPYFSTP
jgi:hypothetical protein